MAVEKTGVELNLKENVTAALKRAGAAAIKAGGAMRGAGNAASGAFSAAGASLTGLNQGLEIAKKGMELFRAAVTDNITKALEFKDVNDQSVQGFKDLARETELVRARIGDMLIPVVQGFAEGIMDATGSMSDLIAENQKLVGSKLVEWIGTAANGLTTVLAKAVLIVGKAIMGWEIIIDGVKAAVSAWFGYTWKALSKIVEAASWVSKALGMDGISKHLDMASEFAEGLGDTFLDSSSKSVSAIEKTAAEINAFDATVKKVEGTVKRVIGESMVKAQKAVQEATTGTTKTIEEQRAAIEKAGEAARKAESAVAGKKATAGATQTEADKPTAGEAIGQAAIGEAAAGLGAAGSIISGAVSGGGVGAIIGTISAIVQESVPLQKIFGKLQAIFTDIVASLDPLFAILTPVLGMITGTLTPYIKFVGDVLKKLATTILFVFESIAKVWNGLIGAIASVLRKLGSIKVFGKKPLGALEEWGDKLQAKASVSMSGFEEARRQLEEGWDTASEELDEGAGIIKDTVEKMGRELVNVPAILKVALHEFRAATPEGAAPSMTRQDAYQSAKERTIANMPGRGAGLHAETVNVYQATNTDELVEQAGKEARRQSFIKEGSLAMARAGIAFG